MRSHGGWLRRHLARSLRVRLGALVLALVTLPAIFAEMVAADAPWLALGPAGMALFPGLASPQVYAGKTRQQIAQHHANDDMALWPLVSFGPDSVDRVKNAPVSSRHPLGTDDKGRDVFARLLYGARTALGLTAAVLLLSLLLGVLLGASAAHLGGFWDELLSRPLEVIEALPTIVVVAVTRAIAPEAAVWSLVLAAAAVRFAEIARLVRAEVLRANSADYVVAARALGCSDMRILARHIMPSAARPVVVSLMFGVASLVLLEVAVSFLGWGIQGSWGVIIAEGLGASTSWAATCAAVALVVTVASAYLLADAVTEMLDARVASRAGRSGAAVAGD